MDSGNNIIDSGSTLDSCSGSLDGADVNRKGRADDDITIHLIDYNRGDIMVSGKAKRH